MKSQAEDGEGRGCLCSHSIQGTFSEEVGVELGPSLSENASRAKAGATLRALGRKNSKSKGPGVRINELEMYKERPLTLVKP